MKRWKIEPKYNNSVIYVYGKEDVKAVIEEEISREKYVNGYTLTKNDFKVTEQKVN